MSVGTGRLLSQIFRDTFNTNSTSQGSRLTHTLHIATNIFYWNNYCILTFDIRLILLFLFYFNVFFFILFSVYSLVCVLFTIFYILLLIKFYYLYFSSCTVGRVKGWHAVL